jgi:hypothetical protein
MSGLQAVSLTRSPEIAAHWAFVPREDDDGFGTILIFDRRSLAQKHRLVTYHWDPKDYRRDEMEECVSKEIELGRHLIGMVSSERMVRSREQRHRAHQCRVRRLEMLTLFSPDLPAG